MRNTKTEVIGNKYYCVCCGKIAKHDTDIENVENIERMLSNKYSKLFYLETTKCNQELNTNDRPSKL